MNIQKFLTYFMYDWKCMSEKKHLVEKPVKRIGLSGEPIEVIAIYAKLAYKPKTTRYTKDNPQRNLGKTPGILGFFIKKLTR